MLSYLLSYPLDQVVAECVCALVIGDVMRSKPEFLSVFREVSISVMTGLQLIHNQSPLRSFQAGCLSQDVIHSITTVTSRV